MKHPQQKLIQSRANNLFAFYYSLGHERSINLMYERLAEMGMKLGRSTLQRYSKLGDWPQKALDTDAKAMERQQEALTDETLTAEREMNKRHMQIGVGMQAVAVAGLKVLRAGELSAGEVSTLAKEGTRIERLAGGLATERSEVAVRIYNVIIKQIVALFVEINALPDPQQRTERFALGVDGIVEAQLLSTGG